MPDLGNSSVFSQTDASNNTGTMPSWSGTAAPSTLDDAGRAFQGAVTREWNWRNYTLTAGGTADAKTLTYTVAPAAYYNGQRFSFIANTVNATTTPTLNVNGLGAVTIKKVVAGALTALVAGDLVAGAFVEVAYNTAGTCFVWVNASGVTTSSSNTFTANQIISVTDNTNAALRVTQLGTGNAILVEDSANPDSTPFVVDQAGNVGIGVAAPAVPLDVVGQLRSTDSTVDTRMLSLNSSSVGIIGTYSNHDLSFFVNGAQKMRLSTAGVLTVNGASVGGTTLLGTLTTTSGASQSLTSLTLTGYKFLRFVFNGVSGSSTGLVSLGSVALTATAAAADTLYGIVDIELSTGLGLFSTSKTLGGTINPVMGNPGYTNASTSVSVTIASGAFDAGSVTVYGIA